MAQQAALSHDIGVVQVWVDEHAAESGGFWLDNTAAEEGTGLVAICLGLAEDADLGPVLLGRLEHPEQLRVVRVRRTEARLRQVAQELVERRLPGVSGVGVDVIQNRVHLYLARLDEALLRELVDAFGEDMLDIREGVVTARAR